MHRIGFLGVAVLASSVAFAQQLNCPTNNSATCSQSGSAMTITNTSTSSGASAGSFVGSSYCGPALKGVNTATGLCGELNGAVGVYGEGTSFGVQGTTTSGDGVFGSSSNGNGVRAASANYNGLYGSSSSASASGVYGENFNGGFGIAGRVDSSGTNWAVLGDAQLNTGKAGKFVGSVTISGALTVSGTKSFKIDHPLDPENKYLVHSCVESDQMKNVYDGVAVLDSRGEAVVRLPDWFEALNRDFRYQLTPLGSQAQLFVAAEVRDRRFKIAGGKPGLRVSWQITGVRRDRGALAHPMQVEELKPEELRGKYIQPEAFGADVQRSENFGILQRKPVLTK